MNRYDEEVLEHFKLRRTIANFQGKVYLPSILFDIDKGKASDEDLLTYVKQFIYDLDLPDEHVQAWYSGRGYHIVVPNLFGLEGSNDLPAIMKATMRVHFPEVDQIYDGTRLIRVGFTINKKTGLYKTPFKTNEIMLFSFDDIKRMSSTQRKDFHHSPFPTDIKPIWADKVIKSQSGTDTSKFTLRGKDAQGKAPSGMPNGDARKEMNGVVTCVQKIYNEGPVEGTRHMNMIRLISAYRRQGMPREAVHSVIRDWVAGEKGMTEYEAKMQVNQIYDKGYRFSCQDAILAKYCDSRCVHFSGKNLTLQSNSAADMEKSFAKYAQQDFSKTAINLKDYYPSIKSDWMIYPGELVIVTGITGLGKTAWVQNLVVMVNQLETLFFSLELHKNLVYRRFIQMAHRMAKHEVFEHYKNVNPDEVKLSDAIQHINVVTTTPELEALERMVAETKPKIVVVDTTDEIEVAGMRSFDKDVKIALGLKHIAEKYDLIMIGIHHTNKAALQSGKVTLAGLGGTSKIPQKADKVLAINGNAQHLYRSLDSLKMRDEKFISIQFELERKSFWYNEVKG